MTQPAAWSDTAENRRASRHDEHRAPRRDAIIRAAIEAIEEDGPGALTGQIAERAGQQRTHMYRHFGSKAELDQAVARVARAELTGQIRSTLGASGRPIDLIRQPIAAMLTWAQSHPNVYRFLMARSAESARRPLPQGTLVGEVLALSRRYLEQSDAPRNIDAVDGVMTGVIGLIDARVLWWLDHPAQPVDELTEELARAAWLLIDQHLRSIGVELDPDAVMPLPT